VQAGANVANRETAGTSGDIGSGRPNSIGWAAPGDGIQGHLDGYGRDSPRATPGTSTPGNGVSEGFESPGGGSLALENPRSDGGASPGESVRSDQWVDVAHERNLAIPSGEGPMQP
jgi:hypothetical protein